MASKALTVTKPKTKKNEVTVLAADILSEVVVKGDLAKLNTEQRMAYVVALCRSLGLNPATQPFSYMVLNNKHVLYANKSCTDQLRQIHEVSVTVKERKLDKESGVASCEVEAKLPDGRVDFGLGAVGVTYFKKKEELGVGEKAGQVFTQSGTDLANAMMKAETKAKRRATLSICGLGMLDESEIESIRGAEPEGEAAATLVAVTYSTPEQIQYLVKNEVPVPASYPSWDMVPQGAAAKAIQGHAK